MALDRNLGMLSIAAKAGKIVSGNFMVEKTIASGEACLVIVSEDASDNTKKKITDSCNYYKVKYFVYGDSDSLGRCIGKEFRKVLAVTDEGIAKSIIRKMEVIG